jgi:hypothetical protein
MPPEQTTRPTRRDFLRGVRDVTIAVAAADLALSTPAAAEPDPEPAALSQDDQAALLAISRRICPLKGVDLAPHQAVVTTLAQVAANDANLRTLLVSGCASLRADLGGDWATDETLDAWLRKVETTPFFRAVTSIAIPTFISQRPVWAAVGYEGESRSKGGYLYNGFDSLDWLPEPPADRIGRQS